MSTSTLPVAAPADTMRERFGAVTTELLDRDDSVALALPTSLSTSSLRSRSAIPIG
jgi:hypothetical protein